MRFNVGQESVKKIKQFSLIDEKYKTGYWELEHHFSAMFFFLFITEYRRVASLYLEYVYFPLNSWKMKLIEITLKISSCNPFGTVVQLTI